MTFKGWRGRLFGFSFALAFVAALILGRATPGVAQMPEVLEPEPVLPGVLIEPEPVAPVMPIDIDGYWGAACIRSLAERRIVEADEAGLFWPEEPILWQDFTQMLNQAVPPGETQFWNNPLEAALGITTFDNVASHYPKHFYQPERPLTRSEAMMAAAAKINAPFITRPRATLAANFDDADQLFEVALEGVAAALARNLIVSYPDPRQLAPNRLITRGEAAALICQLALDPQEKTHVPEDYIPRFQTPPEATPPETELRGVWLTNIDSDVLFSKENLAAAVDQLAELHFNTLYPTVWNWGYTLYPSAVAEQELGAAQYLYGENGPPRPEDLQTERDMLQELIELAHAKGMRVIPWFEFGFMAPTNYPLYQRHPDWFTQYRLEPEPEPELKPESESLLPGSLLPDGLLPEEIEPVITPKPERPDPSIWMEGGRIPRRWMNPFHPEAQRFLLQLANEIVTNYEVDGFQVDDHIALPKEFGYDPYTTQLYQSETGAEPPEDPTDAFWTQWRANKISDFMTQLHQVVKARRPEALLSVSPNPYPFAYVQYLQDWPEWERRGIVDELIIQVYRDQQTRFVWEMTKPTAVEVRDRIPTHIGIMSGLRHLPVSMVWIRAQIDAVRDRGYAGVSFFFYETLWNGPESREARIASLKEAFATPAAHP